MQALDQHLVVLVLVIGISAMAPRTCWSGEKNALRLVFFGVLGETKEKEEFNVYDGSDMISETN